MESIMQALRNLGPLRIVMLVVAGLIMIAVLGFLTTRLTTPVMSTLYSNLSMDDASKIAAQLDASNTKYELRANGTQIVVPNDEVLKLRMNMAVAGLPAQGSIVGYEIFDKSETFGTSNFVHNINLVRALEGELSRTIASFSIIDSARVHLVIPKRELFVNDKSEPSASVVLKLKGSTGISKGEVAAIMHLVASAVPNLKPNHITIVDNNGNMLSKPTDDKDPAVMAENSEAFKTNYESHLKSEIEDLLEKSVGNSSVKAQVSVDMDFDRITTSSESYDPNTQVARSVQTSEEKQSSVDKQGNNAVTVANNLPPAQAGAKGEPGNSSTSNSQKTDETTNYEISKVVKSQVKEVGTVKKISVAVLVDGIYTPGKTKTDPAVYSPRSQEELDKLKSLVKSAIGFDEKRGDSIEVVNMQFSRDVDMSAVETPYEWIKRDFDNILKTVVIGVVAILVILLVIRPLVNRAFEISPGQEEGEAFGAIAGPGGSGSGTGGIGGGGDDRDDVEFDIGKIQNRSTSAAKKISDVINSNPEETLAVIRSWLNQK